MSNLFKLCCCISMIVGLTHSMKIETSKSPADVSILEVELDSYREVSFEMNVYNASAGMEDKYFLRVAYKSIHLDPNILNNFDHLLSLNTGKCRLSKEDEEKTVCKKLDIAVNGSPELDNQTITLVVYRLSPWPEMMRGLEQQQFTIRIVAPTPAPTTPTPPPPSTAQTPGTCPPAIVGADTQIKVSRAGGQTILGVLLAAAFLASFVGNFVFMILWYKAKSQNSRLKSQNQRRSWSPDNVKSAECNPTTAYNDDKL